MAPKAQGGHPQWVAGLEELSCCLRGGLGLHLDQPGARAVCPGIPEAMVCLEKIGFIKMTLRK